LTLRYQLVLSTVPHKKTGILIAQKLLEQKLAACITITALAQSHYLWKGKIEKAKEYLLIIKTESSRFARLKKCIQKNHPYEVPEIIALPITAGHTPYLNWIRSSLK